MKKTFGEKRTLAKFLQELKPGDRIVVQMEPSSQRGLPHVRFYGRTGYVKEKRGRSYVVMISEMGKEKEMAVAPEHLKLLKQ
jgi:large subunit ribosomal protein L21e